MISFVNIWDDKILDTIRTFLNTEFAGSIPVYTGEFKDMGNQSIRLNPVGTDLIERMSTAEMREYILDVSYGIAGNKTAPEGTERPDQIELPPGTPNYAAFKATVLGKGTDGDVEYFELDESWNEFKDQLAPRAFEAPGFTPDSLFGNYTFSYKKFFRI